MAIEILRSNLVPRKPMTIEEFMGGPTFGLTISKFEKKKEGGKVFLGLREDESFREVIFCFSAMYGGFVTETRSNFSVKQPRIQRLRALEQVLEEASACQLEEGEILELIFGIKDSMAA